MQPSSVKTVCGDGKSDLQRRTKMETIFFKTRSQNVQPSSDKTGHVDGKPDEN